MVPVSHDKLSCMAEFWKRFIDEKLLFSSGFAYFACLL